MALLQTAGDSDRQVLLLDVSHFLTFVDFLFLVLLFWVFLMFWYVDWTFGIVFKLHSFVYCWCGVTRHHRAVLHSQRPCFYPFAGNYPILAFLQTDVSFSPSVLLLLLSLYQQSQLRHSTLSVSSQSLFVQHSYQQIILEQREAELETHVPASEGFSIEVKVRQCAPPSLCYQHNVASLWLKCVVASQRLVSVFTGNIYIHE